jgi:hypothetical protein
MPSYSEHEPIRELRRDYVARCFRCNTPLLADLALRSEGLCTACAEGKPIQWRPRRNPYVQHLARMGRPTSLKSRLRRLAGAPSRAS